MPQPCPPYLQKTVTRHGRIVCYVRKGQGSRSRIRLRQEYGTPEFWAAYQAAVNSEAPAPATATAPPSDSLAWLIDRYRQAPAWTALSLATRRQRENILRQVIKAAGAHDYKRITEAMIAAGRDRRGETPFQARHFLDTMRGLFDWAKGAGFVKFNPAAGVKYPYLKSGEGFPVWTEEDVAAYEAHWPLGTRQRVWIAVLLYTGLRRGDAVRLGRQHVRNGIASIRPQKTGGKVEVTDPPAPAIGRGTQRGAYRRA